MKRSSSEGGSALPRVRRRNRAGPHDLNHKNPLRRGGEIFLQRKVWWCHNFAELLWNSQLLAMILSTENRKRGLGSENFSLQPLEGFFKPHVWKVKSILGAFWLRCFDCPGWKPLGRGRTTESGSQSAVMKFGLN